jgi:hypothetical protein
MSFTPILAHGDWRTVVVVLGVWLWPLGTAFFVYRFASKRKWHALVVAFICAALLPILDTLGIAEGFFHDFGWICIMITICAFTAGLLKSPTSR